MPLSISSRIGGRTPDRGVMTQNIYDDPGFFAGYGQLERSQIGLAGMAEWPAMRALLPNLKGKRVVDLGCGYGWFCRWALTQGAREILGIDVSERMLTRARSEAGQTGIIYQQNDLETLTLPEAAFDLAYSSLVLHYVEDLARLFAVVHRALTPGGKFVFSIEHPIYMAPRRPQWRVDGEGHKTWPLDNYLIEGPRRTDWLAPGVVKQHRLMGTTLTRLIQAGFAVAHVEEWRPSDQQIRERPEFSEELERPMFLLVAADR